MPKPELNDFRKWLRQKGRHPIYAAKAHLIGYMEEYLAIKHGMGLGNASDLYMRLHDGESFIKIRYEQLEKEIISADKRKKFMESK